MVALRSRHPKFHLPGNLRHCGSVVLAILITVWGQTPAHLAQSVPPKPAAPPGSAKPTPTPAPSAAELAEAQQLLSALGYWLLPAGAQAEAALRHALIAFQKIAGRPRTGVVTLAELAALRLAQRPAPLESGGPHLEIDLDRQVLFFVNKQGQVERILPISSGSGAWFSEGGRTRRALTPQGRFKIQRKIAGWRKSPLGLLYYPSYFYDGVAIHGNPAVPATPASHGCVRIPMFAAKELFELTPVGTPVLVHSSAPASSAPPIPCKPLAPARR
jgi:hypothetical protein